MISALHAEWTKLRTLASTGWLLLTLAALTIGTGAVTTDVVKCPASCTIDTTRVSLTGIILGQAAAVGLAVLFVTGEYSTGMIRTTLMAIPRRSVMLAAKAVVLSGVIAAAGIVSVLGAVLAGRIFLPGNGYTLANGFQTLSLLHGATLRAAAGSVLYLVLIGLLSLGLGLALRSGAATTTVALGLLYVLSYLADIALSSTWQHRIERWSPMDAGLAIQGTRDVGQQVIQPWPGLGVCALWAAAALLAGWLTLRQRDA
jgi:ABC-2 type transport system permease protein